MLRKSSGSVGSLLVIFQPWTFLGFVRCARHQKLNPVFDPVLCKDEDDLVELWTRDAVMLRLLPKLILQLVAVGHVMI